MWPLDPATSRGAPGRVTPVRSNAGSDVVPVVRSRAWYQRVGTRCPRCMSLATRAAPVVVRRPASAQLLLPTSWRPSPAAVAGGIPIAAIPVAGTAVLGPRAAGTPCPTPAAVAPRTYNTSGPGIPDA